MVVWWVGIEDGLLMFLYWGDWGCDLCVFFLVVGIMLLVSGVVLVGW